MKKQKVPNEVLQDFSDVYLDELIAEYNEAQTIGQSEFEEALYRLLLGLSFREIVTPYFLEFLDNKLNCAFRKGRIPEGVDVFNNEKVRVSPVFVDVRDEGSDDEYVRYVAIVSSSSKISSQFPYNMVKTEKLKDVFFSQVDGKDGVAGIIINPGSDNIMLPTAYCKLIADDFKSEIWEKFLERLKKK